MPKSSKKKSAGELLAENLKALMEADTNLSSGPKVAKASGVTRKSINNIGDNRHDPRLSSIEAIAEAFDLEPYQLLMPGLNSDLLLLYRAYNDANESGRELLTQAAEVALKARERKAGTGSDG